MTAELKPAPCPWCRCKKVRVDLWWNSTHTAVQCCRPGCGASGPERKTEAGAIKAWNKVAEVHRGA